MIYTETIRIVRCDKCGEKQLKTIAADNAIAAEMAKLSGWIFQNEGDWHYSLSSGKISETCQYISLAELERLPDESVNADAAMKELDEKIKLTKEHGSWKGVDVDKFMDDVRGSCRQNISSATKLKS